MTREEMDFIGGMNMCDEISNEAYKKIMCHCEEQAPKTGRWENKDPEDNADYCSNCGCETPMYFQDGKGSYQFTWTRHCPSCGARMENTDEWFVEERESEWHLAKQSKR